MPEPPTRTDPTDRPASARGAAKHVYLSDQARAGVQAWADREGVSFSAALDTLARLALGEDPRDAWSPVLTAKLLGAVRADLGRHRALLAATALDAGIAVRMASAAAKALRPKDYPRMKRLARLEAVEALRRRDALAELGLPTDGDAPAAAGEATPGAVAIQEDAPDAPAGERAAEVA
jgi:hypothetical protein